eukprot:7089414-Alexandrium_andersonii.AAC.1
MTPLPAAHETRAGESRGTRRRRRRTGAAGLPGLSALVRGQPGQSTPRMGGPSRSFGAMKRDAGAPEEPVKE